MPIMRTQEEILARLKESESEDIFGVQINDMVSYLTFENAKPLLKPEYVAKVEAGEEKWEQRTDARAEILEYLAFAYMKAEDERGLSAARSLLHFKTWIWLDDPAFYEEIIPMIESYTRYGIPTLDRIAKHYDWVRVPYVYKEKKA